MELVELSNLILSNLGVFDGDPEPIHEVLRYLKDTSISYQEPIYKDVKGFFEQNNKFPNQEFINLKYPHFFSPAQEGFSKDLVYEFLGKLQVEHARTEILEAVGQGRYGDIKKIVNEHFEKTSDIREVCPSDVVADYARKADYPSGVLSGVPEIDTILKGYSYGTLNVVAAPPGCFKTTYCCSYLYNASVKNGFNYVYLSLEGQPFEIWYNLFSRHSLETGNPLSAEFMKKGLLEPADAGKFPSVVKDFQEQCKGKISVISAAEISGMGIESLYRFLQKKADEWGSLDGIIVDYLQLMKFFRPKGVPSDEVLNYYVKYFTDLSTTWPRPGLATVLAAQVNREGWKALTRKGRASLFIFAEANELERSAQTAMIFYTDDAMKNANQMHAFVVKNRSGRVAEDPLVVYVDPDHFLVGAQDFNNVFSVDGLNTVKDEEFFG